MSEYLGSRISLISKSDIRYVGTLHEINSDESTVSLENVRSYGTEGRKATPADEIAPSDQVYEYIVFRGSDVKDLRIEESPPVKENKPPAVPNDPAILGARPRPDAARQGPAGQSTPGAPGLSGPSGPAGGPPPLPGPPGYGHPPQPFNNYYGPPGAWGRGGLPGPGGPGAGFGNMPYPPPPGWYPGGFPPGPGGPGPWNNYPMPPGAPMPGPMPGQDPNQKNRGSPGAAPGQEQKQAVVNAPSDKQKAGPSMPQLPNEPKSLALAALQPQGAPTPPVDSKPSVDQVKAAASAATTNGQVATKDESRTMPTGPKNNRVAPVFPAMPRPFQVPTSIAGPQSSSQATGSAPTAATIQDATEAAKAAVAIAMAKMEGSSSSATAQAGSREQNGTMDNLTKKVQEMRVNAARSGQNPRGRGRGGRGGHAKIEVPDADFDFASSNAKFNKGDVVKEAIAGSPLTETDVSAAVAAPEPTTTETVPAEAYNRQKSFFDNISSEAKDRAESGTRPGGREWRGEEQRKNIETFGQGSVDGGHRNYRGRGRGRGGMRGRRAGFQRGNGGGYRNRDNQAPSSAQQ